MNANRPNPASVTGKAQKRAPRSIRFFDPEWERIAAFAGDRGLSPAEFVRFATLAAIEDGEGRGARRLAPLIETTFRASYMLVLKARDEMLDAGKQEALELLSAEARKRQDELLSGGSD